MMSLDGTEARRFELTARLAEEARRVPWPTFVLEEFRPQAGEHVAIVGPTGQGKTVLQNNILPLYPFVAVFATKPQDSSMDALVDSGYVKLAQWRGLNPIDYPRRVIWPNAMRKDATALQRKVFDDAFDHIFREVGRPKDKPVGWALAIDEMWYVVNELDLKAQLKKFLYQARSLGHNLILATQRPFYVPPEVYDQSTHLFFFRDNDYRSLQRLGEINARDATLVRYAVKNLDQYQVLYVNTRTGAMARTRTPIPAKG